METILLIAKELLPLVLVAAVTAIVSYDKGYKEGAIYAMDSIYDIIEKHLEELKLRIEEKLEGK
jgi:hypothetical protein